MERNRDLWTTLPILFLACVFALPLAADTGEPPAREIMQRVHDRDDGDNAVSDLKMDSNQLMESEWPIADYAMVVASEARSVEPRFMAEFLKSDDGQDSTAVLANLCYVEAEHSVGTQLANMCAYFARRWLQYPDRPHPYFDAIRDGRVVQVIYPVTLD